MCLFEYDQYQSCGCEFFRYSAGPNTWCKQWLDPYPWYKWDRKDAPKWKKTLIIQNADEHGIFDYFVDYGKIYRTLPEDPGDRIRRVGCVDTNFKKKDVLSSRNCPYCKPGGEKDILDKEKRSPKKAEAGRVRRAWEAQKMQETQKAQDGDSCCIVQ